MQTITTAYSTTNMNIIYLTSGISNKGGIERIVISKANYLGNLGHNVSICNISSGYDSPAYTLGTNVKLISIKKNTTISIKQKTVEILHLKQIVQKQLEELNPNIIISANCALISWILPFILRKTPKILELHFSYEGLQLRDINLYKNNKSKIFLHNRLRHLIYPFYNKVVVLTEHDRLKWNMKNCITIPNYSSFKQHYNTDNKKKRIIAVGRLNEQKGFDRLINAWRFVVEKHPDYKLDIYGEGKLQKDLEKQITYCNLQQTVSLKGNTSDIDKEYAISQFLVLSSIYEGLPMVILEAFNFGLPCVCFNIAGIESIITNNYNGILIRDGDIKALGNAISGLIENPELLNKMSKNAYDCSQIYSAANVMEQWINLFEKLHKAK